MPDGDQQQTQQTTQQTQQATQQTQQTAAPWHGLTAPEDVAYITNKGWQNPADMFKSYRGVETLVGRDPSTLIPMPKADDPAGLRAVFAKLGMPETPAKYEFDSPKDMKLDDNYLTWARENFHKVGLTASQAKSLTTEHNAYVKSVLDKQVKDYNLSVTSDKQALLAEWGDGHERKMAAASAAAKNLGFDQPLVDAIEQTIGFAKTMRFFSQLGEKLGEDSFLSGGTKTSGFGGVTPEEAKSQWNAMKTDPVTVAALKDKMNPGHAAALEKQTRLFKLMHPETK